MQPVIEKVKKVAPHALPFFYIVLAVISECRN